MQNVVITEA